MKLFNFFKKKEPSDEPVSNPPELLAVKLFFIEEPKITDEKIRESLKKQFKEIEFPDPEDDARQYFFNDYKVQYQDGEIPAQGIILTPETVGMEFEELETAFQQNGDWEEAETVVKNCNHEILLTDLMSRGLDYKLRLECFQKFVASVVEVLNPAAIWMSNSQRIIKTEVYLEHLSTHGFQDLYCFLNTRLFNIQNSNGEMIMDTLGLHSLSLPDFEIKFKGFDPSTIAGLLFNYGNYIYENGVIIENGNTIQGIEKDQKWKCYFRESLVEPKRIVIEVETERK